MKEEDTFIINTSKEYVKQIVKEQIELHESKGKKYGYIGLLIFISSYIFLLYLVGNR